MNCPTCPDERLVISDRSGIEIDHCPACRGIWLDRGELDKLLDRAEPGTRRRSDEPYASDGSRRRDARQDDDRYDRRDWDDHDDRFDGRDDIDDDRDDRDDRRGGPRRRRRSILSDLLDF